MGGVALSATHFDYTVTPQVNDNTPASYTMGDNRAAGDFYPPETGPTP
ncbi:MAG: hypothetical protein KJP07_16920 [Desulfatitalea sp.]|nr:hypothetical protein [Desulfatitalea sp.]